MFRYLNYVAALLVASVAIAASAQSPKNSVSFRLTEISRKSVGNDERMVWAAVHESSQGTAKFQMSILLKRPTEETPFPFSKGSFTRVAGSKPDGFIAQLAHELLAKNVATPKSKLKTLPFDVVFLGFDLSRAAGNGRISGGAFSAKPPGPWIAAKIFLGKEKGQVFLNLNPTDGIGEFSIKDESYSDVVVNELAKVF